MGVRREKAAPSSGCKPYPVIAPESRQCCNASIVSGEMMRIDAVGSLATDPFSASVEQCPLFPKSGHLRHESEMTLLTSDDMLDTQRA